MEECIRVNQSKPKRVRSANYSIQERKLLFSICNRYEEILKCKKTDIVSIRKKDEAWKKVTHFFNAKSNSGIWRDKSSLKGHYENSKRKNRNCKLLSKERQFSLNDSNYSPEEESNTSHEIIYSSLNEPSSVLTVHSNNIYKNEDSISIEGEVVVKTEKNVQNWEHLLDNYENRHIISKVNDISKQSTTINNSTQTIGEPTRKSHIVEEQITCSNHKPSFDTNYSNENRCSETNLITVKRNENGDALQKIQSMLIKEDTEVLCVESVKLSNELLRTKIHMVQFQLEREKAEFELRKKALVLDIQIREKYLEKLNSINGFNISSIPKLLE